jgi:hypothetical protein
VPSHIQIPKVEPTDRLSAPAERKLRQQDSYTTGIPVVRIPTTNDTRTTTWTQLSLHCLAAHLLCSFYHITLHQTLGIQPYQIR